MEQLIRVRESAENRGGGTRSSKNPSPPQATAPPLQTVMAAEVVAVVIGRIMAPNIFRNRIDLQAIAVRALVVEKFFSGSEHHLPDP
jgi:hypothetical protein